MESPGKNEILGGHKCSRASSREEENQRIGGFSCGGARGKGRRRYGGVVLGRIDSCLVFHCGKN